MADYKISKARREEIMEETSQLVEEIGLYLFDLEDSSEFKLAAGYLYNDLIGEIEADARKKGYDEDVSYKALYDYEHEYADGFLDPLPEGWRA